jgi:hypothetical protein
VKTLTGLPEMTDQCDERDAGYACVNPEHRLLAARKEELRVRDRRWRAPAGRIPQHDYCATTEKPQEPPLFRGRAASCPLGAQADDHAWLEAVAPREHAAGDQTEVDGDDATVVWRESGAGALAHS